ncbi:hypothetical protein [uncultured Erythrobacter sp.]|uniref:head-tail connector protein n=1 Tax=uncultured Erythrobacter sp. TaxID=263913 RepID=UPI0026105133|nr:hypothetical protein [uncultured Erythrobacter sp.]
MQRRIVEPADVGGEALADLKSWLGITRPNEDVLLIGLLQSALSMCEGFTGQTPLSQLVEERLPIQGEQSALTSRPVSFLSRVEIVSQGGDRTELNASQFEAEIQANGNLVVQLLDSIEGQALVVTASVGLSDTWDALPAPLKQGIIRLSAHHYRDRDRHSGDKTVTSPPAIVSALWRPWRAVRLT